MWSIIWVQTLQILSFLFPILIHFSVSYYYHYYIIIYHGSTLPPIILGPTLLHLHPHPPPPSTIHHHPLPNNIYHTAINNIMLQYISLSQWFGSPYRWIYISCSTHVHCHCQPRSCSYWKKGWCDLCCPLRCRISPSINQTRKEGI